MDDINIIFPQFKFLENQFAEKMLYEGSVKLSFIKEFQDLKYIDSGKIYDKEEGKLSITNHYSNYFGYVKNANGVLPIVMSDKLYNFVHLKDLTITDTIQLNDSLIYCTSSSIFSETLNQSLEDKKDCCVMISNPENFISSISLHERLQDFCHYAYKSCNYVFGKEFCERDPDENSITNFFLRNNSVEVAYIKPYEFRNHSEHRAIWIPKNLINNYEPQIISIPKIANQFLKITFENITSHKLHFLENNKSFGVKVVLKNGAESFFMHKIPRDISSPVIIKIKDDDNELLGFLQKPNYNTISDAVITNCAIGFMHTVKGLVLHLNYLKDIQELNYFIN